MIIYLPTTFLSPDFLVSVSGKYPKNSTIFGKCGNAGSVRGTSHPVIVFMIPPILTATSYYSSPNSNHFFRTS